MLEDECTIQEAEEVIDSEDGEEEKFIVYDKNKKGFYVRQRKYDANDIRLLAECVYSARFIDEKRANLIHWLVHCSRRCTCHAPANR